MAGYTRQDTANNIANGNVIDADDFDAEYNAVEAAFNASSGHKHDGTAGEGAPITKVGPSQDIIVSATNVNPKTTNTLDLGVSAGVKFKDGYFQGTLVGETAVKAGTNRYMTLTDNELDVSTGDLTLDVEGNIVIDANGGDITLKDDGATFGGISNSSGQTVIKSGTTPTTAITFSDADATLAGNTTVSGTLDVTGDINFNSTTTSTTKTTGAVIIDGGVGIAENVNIGGDVAIDGNLTVSGAGKNITGDLIGDVKAANGTSVLDSGTDGTDATFTGDVTGDLTGNADTATTWATAREIALTGDVTGTVTGVNGGGNISIATTISADSVALGTDTTGNYVNDVTAGTGVTVTHTAAEGSSPTIAIGQAVETNSNVTFNDVTVSGNLTVSGTTTTVNTETINLADNQIVLNSNFTGETPTEDGGIEIERGDEDNKTLIWDESDDKWTIGSETFVAGTFEGNLTGDVTGTVQTAAQPNITSLGTLTTLTVDDISINDSTISDAGDLTLDVGSDIILDSDTGNIVFKDGGVNQGSISFVDGLDTSNLVSFYAGTTKKLEIKPVLTTVYGDLDTTGNITSDGNITADGNSFASDVYSSNDIYMTAGASDWKFTVNASNELVISYGGVNKMKLDSSGNLTVTGNVTAYGTV